MQYQRWCPYFHFPIQPATPRLKIAATFWVAIQTLSMGLHPMLIVIITFTIILPAEIKIQLKWPYAKTSLQGQAFHGNSTHLMVRAQQSQQGTTISIVKQNKIQHNAYLE